MRSLLELANGVPENSEHPERESGGVRGEMRAVERALPLPAKLVRPHRLLHSRGVHV